MNLQDIRNLIGQGDTAGALKALANLIQEGAWRSKRLRDDLLILSSQFEDLKRKESIGLLPETEFRHQFAQLNSALLNVIDEMESGKIPSAEKMPFAESETREKRKIPWWALLLALLLPLAGFGVWQVFFKGGASPELSQESQVKNQQPPEESAAGQATLAIFEWHCEPASCAAPCEVHFTNNSQNARRFLWDFGDGQTSMEESPMHKYLQGKSYTVTLTAIGPATDDIKTQTIQIHAPPKTNAPASPVAMFRMDKSSCTVPCTINFTNLSENANRYSWQVNGKTVGSDQSFRYTFTKAGDYRVRLIAARGSREDSYEQGLLIEPDKVEPVARFVADRYLCTGPCTVSFTNQSENADRYIWAVNDAKVSKDRDYTYSFSKPGKYEITLYAFRGDKAAQYERTITLAEPEAAPQAAFRPSTTNCTAPCSVGFTNQSKNADKYIWYVGTTLKSREPHFKYTFQFAGQYTVKLIAYKGNMKDSRTATIVVNKPASASPQLKELIYRLEGINTLLDAHPQSMNNEHAIQLDNWLRGWYIGGNKELQGQSTLSLIQSVDDDFPNINWSQVKVDLQKVKAIIDARSGERQAGKVQKMDYTTLRAINSRIKKVRAALR